MSWLARLERHVHRWPRPVRWLYTGAKWYLIAAGVIVLLALWLQRLSGH